ncbi:hypothetical protein BACCIP111883_01884 [Sutcliffiella rhizosphaerae]|uniref:Helix-turn-helix domain-containing protein n=1 Tax=Sutcliffiella rhizosphaerae TaxID=2880967 RepID=A0ABM8YMD5_9BACI|nr:hypothetical protein BACCIP111883_01884 [Sutcliffiella rhizosphaerae]
MKIKVRSWRLLTAQDKMFILKALSRHSQMKVGA